MRPVRITLFSTEGRPNELEGHVGGALCRYTQTANQSRRLSGLGNIFRTGMNKALEEGDAQWLHSHKSMFKAFRCRALLSIEFPPPGGYKSPANALDL